MQASAGIFPDESRKLLSEIPNNAAKSGKGTSLYRSFALCCVFKLYVYAVSTRFDRHYIVRGFVSCHSKIGAAEGALVDYPAAESITVAFAVFRASKTFSVKHSADESGKDTITGSISGQVTVAVLPLSDTVMPAMSDGSE